MGGEKWALTARLKGILLSCNRRMLRYMAGVTWRDRVRSAQVAMCGVRELGDVLIVRRLWWFGHLPELFVLFQIVSPMPLQNSNSFLSYSQLK